VPGEISLEITRTGDPCSIQFEPSMPGPAMEVRAEVNGKQTPVEYAFSPEHHHVKLEFALQEGKNLIRLRIKNDFGIAYEFQLPELGNKSSDLRVLSQKSDQSSTTLMLAGRAGATYHFDVWNPGIIEEVRGGELLKQPDGTGKVRVSFEGQGNEEYSGKQLEITFRVAKMTKGKPKGKE